MLAKIQHFGIIEYTFASTFENHKLILDLCVYENSTLAQYQTVITALAQGTPLQREFNSLANIHAYLQDEDHFQLNYEKGQLVFLVDSGQSTLKIAIPLEKIESKQLPAETKTSTLQNLKRECKILRQKNRELFSKVETLEKELKLNIIESNIEDITKLKVKLEEAKMRIEGWKEAYYDRKERLMKTKPLKFYNSQYYGELKDGESSGKGVEFFSNGEKYEGEFVNGVRSGIGLYTFSDGNKYEGYWSNSQENGLGILMYENGERYEGQFKNSNEHGLGIFYYLNGDRFEGHWRNGEKNGKGSHYYDDGYFEGEYLNNKKHGKGVHYLDDGSIKSRYYEYGKNKTKKS